MVDKNSKLKGVHPELVNLVTIILRNMEMMQHPMMVTDGVRTAKQQNELFLIGRAKPGKRVTDCDGYKTLSNHQAKADGFGHAVDCCFVVNGKPAWNENLPWHLYGELAESLGLQWGGRWKFKNGKEGKDKPHIEMRHDDSQSNSEK